jgi:MFS family permease
VLEGDRKPSSVAFEHPSVAFEHPSVDRKPSSVAAALEASARVLRKPGFTDEGLLRRYARWKRRAACVPPATLRAHERSRASPRDAPAQAETSSVQAAPTLGAPRQPFDTARRRADRHSVLRRIPDRNIWLIYTTIFLVGLGYGSTTSLLSIFLDGRGLSKPRIAWLATAFALGIVSNAIPVGALIRRFSAKGVLVGAIVGYALAITAFPFVESFPAMAAARFVDGACSVGVWVSCETILLSRADARNKAFVTSLYAIALALGYVLGPLSSAAIVHFLPMKATFPIAGAIAVGASLLVLARLDGDVQPTEGGEDGAAAEGAGSTATTGAVFWRIKTSCLATFSYGYFQASVLLFLPLYLIERKGITREQTILITAFFAAGMLGFSNVAGRLGDRYGHLFLMRVLAVVGAAMIAGFIFLDRYAAMCVAVLVAGATLASISPVSLALQGVVTPRAELSRANAVYNVFYATGMLIGPLASGAIYAASGGVAMLLHLLGLWVVFVVVTIVFAGDDPARARHASA